MKNVSCLAAAVFAAAIFTIPPLFAGGQIEGGPNVAAPGIGLSAPGRLPLVEKKVTLTAFIPSIGLIADLRTNADVLWLEKVSNVHIEWIESSKVDAKNKLAVLLASGDYPDIIFGANGSGLANQDMYRYGMQGVFLPLNDLIEKQGFWIKELFAAEPGLKQIITSPDGKIYGLPAVFTDDYHMTMRQKFWINKAWLDRLGLELPATTDEFHVVMKAFKKRDANGNGDANDEIPMTGAKRSLEDLVLWLMGAFVPAGGPDDSGDAFLNCYEFVVNGNVSFSANTDEFREGLRFVRKLYKEGLFDVAALTQDRSQIKPLVEGAVNRIGGAASHHPGNFTSLSDDKGAPINEYVALPPLKGPSGNASTPWLIDAVIKSGEFVITDKCKYPELAFRWADQFYRLESMMHDKGIEGVHWSRVPASENLSALNGKTAKYKYLKPLAQQDNAQINMGPGWTRDLKNEFAKSSGFSYEEYLYNATKRYEPYKIRRYPYATVSISDADFTEFTDLRRTLHAYIAEATDRFVIGDMDIETQWDGYVSQLEQIGLSRYISILQESL